MTPWAKEPHNVLVNAGAWDLCRQIGCRATRVANRLKAQRHKRKCKRTAIYAIWTHAMSLDLGFKPEHPSLSPFSERHADRSDDRFASMAGVPLVPHYIFMNWYCAPQSWMKVAAWRKNCRSKVETATCN